MFLFKPKRFLKVIRRNIFLCVAICLMQAVAVNAQSNTIDSLKQLLKTETKDTSRVLLLNQLSKLYLAGKPDTAMVLAQEGLALAKKVGFVGGEAISLNRIASV